MEGVREYVLAVTAAALICSILSGMTKQSGIKDSVRLLCGLFLAMALLAPLVDLDLESITALADTAMDNGGEFQAEGEKLSRQAMADIIKAETEAYILDKAAALGADISAEVILSREEIPAPEAVILRGAVPPSLRQQFSDLLERELGIAKENQQWTG